MAVAGDDVFATISPTYQKRLAMIHTRFAVVLSLCLAGPAQTQDEAPSFPDLPEAARAGSGMIQPCLEERPPTEFVVPEAKE